MVAVDKRTRYPEVAKTHSTAQPTMEKIKTMFATHGTPRLQLESDNAPPFMFHEVCSIGASRSPIFKDKIATPLPKKCWQAIAPLHIQQQE